MKLRVKLLLLLGLLPLAWGGPALAEDVYSPRTLELARQLQCPVCGGQSVADSNSELARQMRDIIEQKVQAGETDQQIRDYFVSRYGPSILASPPKSGFTSTLWWVPVLAIAGGGVILALFLRERTRAPQPGAPTRSTGISDEELEQVAREALGGDSQREVQAT